MSTTLPNTTPAQYSTSAVTRTQLTSGLNAVNIIAMRQFQEIFGFMPYALVNELAGNIEKADNKEVRWYQSHGRYMGFVTSSAAVTVATGAPATITVGSGGYSSSGTASLPANGMVFYNSRTGIEGKVSSVSTAVAYAHTFVLTPVNTTENVSTLAGDELLNRGQKYLGGQSTKTATVVRNIDLYSNFQTELRKDSTLTDLAMAEKLAFDIDGQPFFTYKQKRDDDISLLWERELLIMESIQVNNVGDESGCNGVIKQVQANGINGTFSQFGIQSTFAEMDRAWASMGAPNEHDMLADKIAYQNVQNAVANSINNGAIIYSEGVKREGIDLSLEFKSFSMYGRRINLHNYQLFDEQQVYGSSGNGLRRNFFLTIPVGKTQGVDVEGKTVIVKRFCITFQDPMGGNMKWRTANNGLFADPPTSTTAESIYTTIGYPGVKVYGAQQYSIFKGA